MDSPLAYASNEEKTANPRWDKTSLENLTDVMHYAADYDKTEKPLFGKDGKKPSVFALLKEGKKFPFSIDHPSEHGTA